MLIERYDPPHGWLVHVQSVTNQLTRLGQELALQPETLRALAAPPIPPEHGFYDECMKGDIRFALGFLKSSPGWMFGGPSSFGSPGAGGSLGYADPDAGIAYAYVCNRMGKSHDDPQ